MRGSTHLAWGATTGAALAVAAGGDWQRVALGAAVGGLGGLVPDWLQINIPGASKQIRGAFGHRGFSHWIWMPLALYILGRAIAPGVIVAFCCGWASHIALDAFADGVPAFWPFGRLTLAHVKTGGRLDSFTGGTALVLAAVIVAGRFL